MKLFCLTSCLYNTGTILIFQPIWLGNIWKHTKIVLWGAFMKVLMYIRRDYKDNMAGDSIQLTKTMEYLLKRGLQIEVSSDPRANLEKYDLIHLFNTIRIEDTYQFYKNAKKYKKKIVISPIYWNYIKYIALNKRTEILHYRWYKQNILRKEVLQNANLILPSSLTEMKEVEKEFNISIPYKVIPNGVDTIFEEDTSERFYNLYELEDFILCVGRISPHKNQLTLSKVANKLNIPLILVGPINDYSYYYECLKHNKELIYVPKVNHHELNSFYSAAKLHVLVSWYEIPGLVNLEAGLSGCNLLTTAEGSTKDYLGHYALYSTYENINDIETKISRAIKQERNDILRKHIRHNFTWEIVADKLINAYETLV